MAVSSRGPEEYDMEGERPTRIMSQDIDPNTKDTNQIGWGMVYQADITDYINRSI